MFPGGTIESIGLHLIRVSAFVLAAPILGTASTFAAYKVGLIVTLTIVIYTALGQPLPQVPGNITFVAMATRELVVGLFLAFVLHAVMLALRVAGELVGNEMGLGMASAADPIGGQSSPIVGQFYEILFALAFLALNGHHWLIRALVASFDRAPVGTIELRPGLAETSVNLVMELFAAGIAFAAPLLTVLFMVSVLIGFLARTVPQLNIMEFGFNLRIGAALVGLLIFAPMLSPAIDKLLVVLTEGLQAALDALGDS